jgi:hypothetical protein
MDPPHHATDRSPRRGSSDVRSAALRVVPTDRVAEEVETLRAGIDQLSLLIVDRQTQPLHQIVHDRHGLRPVTGPATNDEIVSVVDDRATTLP